MQRINFTQDTLNTLKRSARCSFANAVYKLTMKAQQGLKCDDLFKKSVLMNEVNKLLCKYKLDECISFHPYLEGGISTWTFGVGDISPYIWEIYLNINDVVTPIGEGTDLAEIAIDINANTETTGVSAELSEDGYSMTVYSPPGCFVKGDLIRNSTKPGTTPQSLITFVAGKCPQVETCVDYTEEELNCITPQDLQLLFEFTHKYKETLAKSTKRITSPSTSSSSPSPSDCCNWGSIGGSIGNQSDLVAYLNTIKKNFIAASNESVLISNDIKSLNFLGAGVTATNSGGDISITIPGGGGGGSAYWGDIAGIITEQTDLITYLGDNYYPLVGNPSEFLYEVIANNGLTSTSVNVVKLGGTLVEDTSIDNNGFNLDIYSNTSTPSGILLDLNLNDVGTALQTKSDSGFGIRSKSISGINLESYSYDDCATSFVRNDVSTDSIVPVSKIYRGTTGVAQDGIGGAFDMWVSTSGTGISTPGTAAIRQVAKWDTANLTTRKSSYELWGVHNGIQQRYFSLGTNRGQLILDRYGVGDFADTPVWLLGVDASGNVIETTVSGGSQTLADTLALGNTSGANDIQFDATQGLLFDNAARLREGTIDAGLGGNKGVAQVCSLEYELKWEAGRLFVMDQTGMFIRQSLYNFTTTPTATDDFNLGYMTGSLWTLDDGTVYECTFAGTLGGDAVWVNRGIGAGIVYITVGALQTLENNGELSLTTLYIITDITPYKLMCKAETVSKLIRTATIVDAVYSGTVNYDLEFDTISNGTIYDKNENVYYGTTLPSLLTINGTKNTFHQYINSCTVGVNSENNIFFQNTKGNTLGENCINNTFGQGAIDFTFGDNLQNVTIDAGMTGADYSDPTTYAFLYNNTYASTIFQSGDKSGSINCHRYFDIANDRIVVTNLSTLDETYIGGSGGVYIKDANDNVFFSNAEQSTTTFVGVYACTNNIFHQGATNNTLGDLSQNNTFGQDSYGFTFGEKLRNVTIEANIIGSDYSDGTAYAFIYNKDYASTIFQSGGITYHRYYDVATDRIVITLMASPFTVSYIGGGDMLKSTYDTDNSGVVDNAEAIIVIGRNATGSVLRKGTIVYINGSTGNRPNFVKAQANAESTSAGTFGVIVSDIANNADGNCCAIGYLDTLDTRSTATYPFTSDTLADGDTVYLSPTTAGYITNVKPSAPDHLVYLGKVTRTSPTNGTIIYRPQNGYELKEIHDVFAQSPAAKDGLFFDATTSLWKARQVTATDIDANVTNTEFGYLDGVTSSIQTQINGKISATSTDTLTNKRITARSGTVASAATPTINTDNVDFFSITGQLVDITNMSTNLTGTPTEGQTLWIAITGTAARAITWGTSFEASTIALPTTTVTTARLDVAFIWNTVTSKWRCVGVA